MSIPAKLIDHEKAQPFAERPIAPTFQRRRYPLALRLAIIIFSAVGFWAVVAMIGWLVYLLAF